MDDKVITRHEAIKVLIQDYPIADQKTLAELLKKHYFIETTQSVLSRDLREIGVIKKKVQHTVCYTLPEFDVITEILKLAIITIQCNEAMIVVKTQPGLAAFVGDYIDGQQLKEILGCLAGENVVFITCCSIKKIQETFEVICQTLHFFIHSPKV